MTKRTPGGYRNMPGEYRLIAISLLRERDGDYCRICGELMAYDEMTIDHIEPVFNGGLHMANNVRLAHASCNKGRSRDHMRISFCKRGHERIPENLRVASYTRKTREPIYGCRLCHNITRRESRRLKKHGG